MSPCFSVYCWNSCLIVIWFAEWSLAFIICSHECVIAVIFMEITVYCCLQAAKRVDDLFLDLQDGYNLIALLEVLSGEALVSLLLLVLQHGLMVCVLAVEVQSPVVFHCCSFLLSFFKIKHSLVRVAFYFSAARERLQNLPPNSKCTVLSRLPAQEKCEELYYYLTLFRMHFISNFSAKEKMTTQIGIDLFHNIERPSTIVLTERARGTLLLLHWRKNLK